jgi:Protein of unknown function (DUF4236)
VGLRFYRRIHFPGGSINFSGSGPSLSIGGRGAHVTFGRSGVTKTIGIPGTGIFYTHHDGITAACIVDSDLTADPYASIMLSV